MSRYSSPADLTAKHCSTSPGMVITLAFMCGHKGARSGASMRGRIPWLCARCVSAKSEARSPWQDERASITTKKEAQ